MLNEIIINNQKGDRFQYEIFPKVTYITGPNGSGKTLGFQLLVTNKKNPYVSIQTDWQGSGVFFRDTEICDVKSNKEVCDQIKRILQNIFEMDISKCFSFGERRLVSIIYTILVNTDKDIIIIDEPENGLHIETQEILSDWINYMSNKITSQIIIITHSPYIASDNDDLIANIKYL